MAKSSEPHAVFYLIDRTGRIQLEVKPERTVPKGARVIVKDSEMPPKEIDPAQSNPRRSDD